MTATEKMAAGHPQRRIVVADDKGVAGVAHGRKGDGMTRVIRIGLPRCLEGRDVVEEQISRAHRYYNRLIEIERRRRESTNKDAAAEAAAEERRAARKESGVYWGTYLLVEASVEQAAKRKELPRFRRWAFGAGRVGVQFQGGLRMAFARGGDDRRIWISSPKVERGRTVSRRYDPEKGVGRAELHLRVASDGRDPVWAVWQCVLDQPLPEDAVVKWAVVVRRSEPGRLGRDRYRDELLLTVDAEPKPDVRMKRQRAVLGVDLGWRRLADGAIRIAAWQNDEGTRGETALPAELAEQSLMHASSLRAIRDRRAAPILSDLIAWVRNTGWPTRWPDWALKRFAHIARWKSPYAWRSLYVWWTANRYEGDDVGYALLERWWQGDRERSSSSDHGERHLWEWEAHERAKAIRRRDDAFRCAAAELTRRASVLVLESFDLRRFARKKGSSVQEKPREDPSSHRDARARSNRVKAAPGRFRALLIQAAKRRGVEVVTVPAAWTTRTCAECGVVEEWDQGAELRHECANGHEWDQDENAARNLLARYRERPGDAKIVVAAREEGGSASYAATTGGRWQRRKAAKQDRSKEGGQDEATA